MRCRWIASSALASARASAGGTLTAGGRLRVSSTLEEDARQNSIAFAAPRDLQQTPKAIFFL